MDERRYSSWLLERISIGETVRLRLGVSTIGRHSSSAIRISDSQYASRHHAEIVVSNDDSSVTIKDLNSVNGIFVNQHHYTNETVGIVNGNLIGIGVSVNAAEDEDDIQLPIYELKYVPIRRVRLAQPPAPPPPVVQDVAATQPAAKEDVKEKNKPNEDDDRPSCSSNNKRENESLKIPKPPVTISDEIFEISDDDDDDAQKMLEKSKAVDKPQEKDLNKNEPKSNNSDKPQEKADDENMTKSIVSDKPQEKELDKNRTKSNENQKPVIDKVHQIDDNKQQVTDDSTNTKVIIKNEKIDQQDDISSSSSSSKNSNLDAMNALNPSVSTQITNAADIPDLIKTCQITENQKLHQPEVVVDTPKEKEKELHVPILSSIKKELIRSVSADIQNIFGDIAKDEDDVVQNKLKEINPLVYNEINGKPLMPSTNLKKSIHNGDFITLTDDEDAEELGTIIPITEENQTKQASTLEMTKSPNIFDVSLNDSKEDTSAGDIKIEETLKQVLNANKTTKDNVDLDEECTYVPHSDDEDIEDLMFSQVFIDDMKAELQDDLENEPDLPQPDNNADLSPLTMGENIQIKQEPDLEVSSLLAIPQELENSCWTISDDEDYDEELETKVNDWSNKIFSQSLNNMSQVYDINTADIDSDNEDIDSEPDDELIGLEDDIDTIADFYNSNREDEQHKEKNQELIETDICLDFNKNLNNEMQTAKHIVLETKPKEDNRENENIEKQKMTETKIVEENSTAKTAEENGCVNNEIIETIRNKEKILDIPRNKETSPDIPNNVNTIDNLSESPIIRKRSFSKNRPVIQSSSSSEDDHDMEKDKIETKKNHLKLTDEVVIKTNNQIKGPTRTDPTQEKPSATAIPRQPPPVIEAPSLPKHKGKLRGVSAEPTTSSKNLLKSAATAIINNLASVKDKIRHENYKNDLKRKWCEKPSTSKKRDKERHKIIKECRKDKLKELAEKQKIPSKEINNKRKLHAECNTHQSKKAKVKITAHNRGAFLVEPEPKLQPPSTAQKTDHHQFKIPKVPNKNPECIQKQHKRSNSVDCMETFSQQISKPDELLLKQQSSDHSKKPEQRPNDSAPPLRRHSLHEQPKQTLPSAAAGHTFIKPAVPPTTVPICKEALAARAVRTTNKITFASMEKNIIESEQNKRKLSKLSSDDTLISSMKTSASPTKKKTVRFNDTPVIHYIERVSGASKKVATKDIMPLTTNKERRHLVRRLYPVIDCTDTIITNILCWSNEWLIKRNAAAEAASDVIFPMPQQFSSFEHYKSILFPLMKIEFISLLERDFKSTFNVKNFKVSLEYVTQNKDRFMLVTKFNYQTRQQLDSSVYELVLLESDKRGPQIFAYGTANRRGTGSTSTIVYEVVAKNFTKEYFNAIKEFNVRPVMDNVRVNFGAFNAVYQLEATPLFQKIINPLELLKSKPPPRKKITYRGCDPLNEKQKQVLLNTYVKIIDETTPNITLLQGPPGTGKSCVITNLALQTLYGDEVRYLDKKILICAQSNAAVDVIAGKLYAISLKMRAEIRFRLIRYGTLSKVHSDVLPIALQNIIERDQLKKAQVKNKDMIHVENKENLRNQILQLEAQIANLSARNIEGTVEHDGLLEKQRQLTLMRNIMNQSIRPEDERSLCSWYLSNANVVCATLSSCVKLFQYVNYFDICIIDEATQCTEPWTLLPLKFGINSLVLVGDTQQLPATVLSKKANELGLGTSLFTRIQNSLDNIPCTSVKSNSSVTTPNNIICGLQTQYRMHPEICKWPNQYFYKNELINAKMTMDFKSPIVPFSILNLAYTQNSTCSNGKITNNLEAEFVAKLLKALDGFIPNKYNSYGVITPYAHHRATLESSIRCLGLTNIMVNTIDSYQGLEKDVIIISNARTNGIGFLSNPQRLNVALTRPKKCLILCGNFKNLETVPAWRCLLESARERKVFHEISANCVGDMQTNVIDKIKIKK